LIWRNWAVPAVCDYAIRGSGEAEPEMASYAAVDAVLMPWAAGHELHVYARERETPLRSIIVYYWKGPKHESAGHMWLEGPDRDGQMTIHGAAPDWHETLSAPVEKLEPALEKMFQTMIARPIWD
jgi:hypothetical protein